MICTRIYLLWVVSQVCKFIFKPNKLHWEVSRWIFKYYMFSGEHDDTSLLILGYVDRDYTSNMDDRKPTTRFSFTHFSEPIY